MSTGEGMFAVLPSSILRDMAMSRYVIIDLQNQHLLITPPLIVRRTNAEHRQTDDLKRGQDGEEFLKFQGM